MNKTIPSNCPILHLKNNQGSAVEGNSGFEAYGFIIKVAKDGRRIWPEEFKRLNSPGNPPLKKWY